MKLIELLRQRGPRVDYHDPYIPFFPRTRRHRFYMRSVPLTPKNLAAPAPGLPYFVHETAVIDTPSDIGPGTKVWHFSHILKNCRIGENCDIGQNAVIGPEVTIGKGCKIQNNISVYKGVTLEDYVFCGPSMVFTKVYNPRAHIRRMEELRPTLVKTGASIGANATIVCGHTIGRYAFIGAGAVLTHDVPDYSLVAGNPARQLGLRRETHCGPPVRCLRGALSAGRKRLSAAL